MLSDMIITEIKNKYSKYRVWHSAEKLKTNKLWEKNNFLNFINMVKL